MLIPLILGYFPGLLILTFLVDLAHKKLVIERKMEKARKNKTQPKDLPKRLWPKWKEHISFTLKDSRPSKLPLSNKGLFLAFIGGGLALSAIGGLVNTPIIALIGYLLWPTAIVFSIRTSKPILETRKSVLKRMFEIGASKGLITSEHSENPTAVITVLNWDDFIKPTKVEYKIRTEFSASGQEGFLQQFNQIFGNETAWVPTDDPEKGTPGWNYDEGKVTINAVPPLPQMAPWSAHYVLDPGVAWSFFPLALGVENGLEVPNPETGEIENVLGFDLSGEQGKVAKKAGYKMSPKITTSPMVFIGGGTGGGKSLTTDTIVSVFGKSSEN
jgi:hypothetical protein